MLLQLSKTVKQSPKSPQIFENNGTFCADRPFSKNRSETNCQKSFVFNQLVSELQSYILSTTTETLRGVLFCLFRGGFNRTSFQQQLKQKELISSSDVFLASIVHPFNNNWNFTPLILNRQPQNRFNRTSFQQQLKQVCKSHRGKYYRLQSYILSTTTETEWAVNEKGDFMLQSYILSTTTETRVRKNQLQRSRLLQSYILSTTT